VLAGGDVPIEFGRAASSRLRAGGRLFGVLGAGLQVSGGLAYEYELDGRTRSSTAGRPIRTIGGGGGTGLADLGLSWRPGWRLPTTFSLGLQGWRGERDGAAVNASLTVEF
jgi:hypothetical protein